MLFLTNRVKRDFLDTCATIQTGQLRIRTPEGEVYDFGQGGISAEIDLHDWAVVTSVATRGNVGLGETYVEGLWDTPNIRDFMTVAIENMDHFDQYAEGNFWNELKMRIADRILNANSRSGSRRNIRAHYDVGNEFYQLWLDPSMTYSSAIYAQDDSNLERGQNRKYDRILDRLETGDRILEIGCGWGGFAERAAEQGRHVTGLTLSPSQKGYADARLDGRADIRLQDYRDSDGKFDNIVSIEMIEAVGQRYWPTYFSTLKHRLSENGKAIVQAITVPDENFQLYRDSSDFIRQHTFPGGMLLSNEHIKKQAQKAGLKVNEIFAFGQDYSRTCTDWSEKLTEQSAKIHKLGYGEAFMRSWKYYLDICAAAFATARTDVVQVELAHAN